jgi:predicted ArsR family transcriptional regulator
MRPKIRFPGHRNDESGVAAVCGLDDPVRRSLYTYVARSDVPVGRDDAASAAGISRSLAAYHLDKLVELGLLNASYQRPADRRGPGAGRPAKMYAKSGREFVVTVPVRDYELAARLLARAVSADASTAARAELWRVARELGVDLGRCPRSPDSRAGGSSDETLNVLAHHGFEPWAADDGTISLANCPFHKLADQYQDVVCAMTLALIDGMLEGVSAKDAEAALEPHPGRCCVVIRTGSGSQLAGDT